MTRIMYDAVTASNVPASATLVAGYGDGYYQNTAEFRARFPHATVVEIAVSSHHNIGVVLDVETGDATPAEAPPWVLMRRAAGVDPTIYCNSSTWPSVRAAFKAAGVPEPHWWIAQYDGDPTIFPGAVAKQYADPGPYDLSSVAAYWPGVDPQEPDMPLTPADAQLVANTLLATRMPAYAAVTGPDGKPYYPTVGEALNGSERDSTLLAGLKADIAASKAELDGVKATAASVLTAVQGILAAGNATVAEVETAIQAELAKLGAALSGIK